MLSSEEMKLLMAEVAEKAAANTVSEAFVRLGLDPHKPLETQRVFATLYDLHGKLSDEEVKEDIIFVRKFRKGFQKATTKVAISFATIMMAGVSTFGTWVFNRVLH